MLRSLIGNNNNVATTTTNGNGSTTTTMNPSLSFERHTVKVPAVELATDIYESLHEEDRPLLRHVWKILYEISYRDAFTEEDERPWANIEVIPDDGGFLEVFYCYSPSRKGFTAFDLELLTASGFFSGGRIGTKDVITGSELDDQGRIRQTLTVRMMLSLSTAPRRKYRQTLIYEEYVTMQISPVSAIAQQPDGMGVHRHAGGRTMYRNTNSPRAIRKQQEKESVATKQGASGPGMDALPRSPLKRYRERSTTTTTSVSVPPPTTTPVTTPRYSSSSSAMDIDKEGGEEMDEDEEEGGGGYGRRPFKHGRYHDSHQ